MTVTSADISLSASHSSKQTYKREESLLAGFVNGGEGFSEETISSGRRITRTQEQSEAFSGATLLDQFQGGQNLGRLEGARTEYLSSLRALQANFSAETINISEATLPPSMAESHAVESSVPSDTTLSAKDRARIELIVTLVEEPTGKRIKVIDPNEFLARQPVDTQLDPLTPPPVEGAPQDSQQGEALPAFGLRYSYRETYSESETTTFSAQGLINTSDGAEVSVDLSVTMSRSFSGARQER
jgi:hypothetical protein